jgi:AraC-like DNA-binding protein
LYKGRYGTSPIGDLINYRIENAKMLLSFGNMQISEVAYTVGFSSIYYFSKYFKTVTGLSPSEYKRG